MFKQSLRTWIHGMVHAIISGGTSGIIASQLLPSLDSSHFAPGMPSYWKAVWTLFAGSAFVSLVKFLNTQPLPELPTPPSESSGTVK